MIAAFTEIFPSNKNRSIIISHPFFIIDKNSLIDKNVNGSVIHESRSVLRSCAVFLTKEQSTCISYDKEESDFNENSSCIYAGCSGKVHGQF